MSLFTQNEQYSTLSEKLKGHNGVLDKPVKLENIFFPEVYNNMNRYNTDDEKHIIIDGLITPIIFNPLGPTINIVGLISNEHKKIELLYYRSLNPFSSSSYIVGACDHSFEMNIFEIFGKLFSKNTFEDFEALQSMPTIILPVSDSMLEHMNSIIITIYESLEKDISDLNYMMEKTLGNPWDLASLQMESALKKRTKNQQEKKFDLNLDDINHYMEITYDQRHLDGIIQSIPLAWEGAIKNNPVATSQLGLDDLSKELEFSGAGTLKANLRI